MFKVKISTGAGGLATLGLIGAAIGVGISSGGALIAIPLVFMFFFSWFLFVCLSKPWSGWRCNWCRHQFWWSPYCCTFFVVACLLDVYLFVCQNLGLIGAAIGVGISSGGALIAIPLVFVFLSLVGIDIDIFVCLLAACCFLFVANISLNFLMWVMILSFTIYQYLSQC